MIATVDSTQAPATARTRARALTVLAAALAALAFWALARLVLDVELTVGAGTASREVGVAAALGTALLAGALGWALLALLERVTSRARTVWTAVAFGVLLLSLGGPFTSGTGTVGTTVLVLLHLLVGTVLIVGLRRTAAGR